MDCSSILLLFVAKFSSHVCRVVGTVVYAVRKLCNDTNSVVISVE